MNPRIAIVALALALSPARADDPPVSSPAGRPFQSVAELQSTHDRAIVRDLTEYIRHNPKADDIEQAYMLLFNKAIDHDWFSDTEAIANQYLTGYPEGAVRPLAQIVATMARAHASQFGEALTSFKTLMRGLDKPDQEEFAVNFADAFVGVASAAGQYSVARQAYEALLKQFEQSPTLRQKVRDDLARLDRVGKPAPHFDVKDINGQPVRLDALKGKYVLVDFWATWCAPCLTELPNEQAAYAKFHDRGFEIVAVSLDESPDPVTDFVKTRKLPWRQVHNASSGGDLVDAFGVANIPATYLLGPDGVIVRLDLRGKALEQVLGKFLGAR
jgi:peroxiredoxin